MRMRSSRRFTRAKPSSSAASPALAAGAALAAGEACAAGGGGAVVSVGSPGSSGASSFRLRNGIENPRDGFFVWPLPE